MLFCTKMYMRERYSSAERNSVKRRQAIHYGAVVGEPGHITTNGVKFRK